ncbi:MAG TPA: NADH-quinone oxidoreductase subunit NuoH [Terriglobales bacterium]|nr:NADH-quinone oxidoreductase subunit NuoH [Terriglobales bacterium]
MQSYLPITTYIVVAVIKIALALFLLLTACAYVVLAERKLIARMQNRWGPTRVGPFGFLQPLADGLKFILKEDIIPSHVYRPLYIAAPVLSLTLALTSIAVIPIGESVTIAGKQIPLQITDVNIALLIILGLTSVGVYGIALAGWSSNSKYSLLGSLRASAQMISYELALGLSLIGVLIGASSLSLREIVNSQAGGHWNLWYRGQFVAFFVYLMAAFAETNRVPFDLPEAETELVAGYHTEYSAMKFAMFFVAEYANMFTVASLATVLFLGGWDGPMFGLPETSWLRALLPVIWFIVKVVFFIFLYIWIRGTLPRFRYDQLMAFGWKVLLPLALANILVTSLIVGLRA